MENLNSQVLETVKSLPVSTRIKAWMFQVNGKFYHIAEYTANLGTHGIFDKTSIWESNKKGKRLNDKEIFYINGKDHIRCINEFLTIV